jgi:hypothetical protein
VQAAAHFIHAVTPLFHPPFLILVPLIYILTSSLPHCRQKQTELVLKFWLEVVFTTVYISFYDIVDSSRVRKKWRDPTGIEFHPRRIHFKLVILGLVNCPVGYGFAAASLFGRFARGKFNIPRNSIMSFIFGRDRYEERNRRTVDWTDSLISR